MHLATASIVLSCLLSLLMTGRTGAQSPPLSPLLRGGVVAGTDAGAGGESVDSGSGGRELQALSQVTALQLVEVRTGKVITNLKHYGTVKFSGSTLPGLSIVAVVTDDAHSVTFAYGNNRHVQTESSPPYAMCGDFLGQLNACPVLKAGTHNVKVTPYSHPGGVGTPGRSLTIAFSLTNGPVAPATLPRPAPVSAPVPRPVPVPVPRPVPVPVFRPVPAPVPTRNCKVPKFVGDWEAGTTYPVGLSEAQGLIIGNDMILISGFTGGLAHAATKNYALDLRSGNASWRPMDDLPEAAGITHGAFVQVGWRVYMCGGYLGGHPGPHIATCLVYDHSVAPGSGRQWKFFTPLPDGRAGGAMVYDPTRHALIFAGGAERPDPGRPDATDYTDAWMYELNKPGAVWTTLTNIPYLANHMSYASTKDSSGKTRHYFVAGQIGENETTGNVKSNYEFDARNLQWIKRKDMPFTRGHASSSTNAVPCGFIIAGGSTNEFGKTDDVSFYNVESDSWTKIGNLPAAENTPVCDIDFVGGYYHCQFPWQAAWKRKIDV